MEEHEVLVDWRGTPINIGDTLIYASPKGRSCSFVEGRVKSFSPTNVVVIPIRESFGYKRMNPTVNVRPDRVTIVRDLGPSSKPTVLEKKLNSLRKQLGVYTEEQERRKLDLPVTSSWLAGKSDAELAELVTDLTADLEKASGIEKG